MEGLVGFFRRIQLYNNMTKIKPNYNKGFSLIEMVLVVAIIGIMSFGAFGAYRSYWLKTKVINSKSLIISSLERSRNSAIAGENDSDWGVYFSGNDMIIFSGVDYSTRDTAFDTTISFEGGVTRTGLDEISFYKNNGRVKQSTPIVINLENILNDSDNITIFSEGVIE